MHGVDYTNNIFVQAHVQCVHVQCNIVIQSVQKHHAHTRLSTSVTHTMCFSCN